ncbi:MAG TPA: sigma-54 dependent transcriptional regulator [Terriglobales bacterium]|nr:sigma-54 dependent transcriptional regulator [Terriglobales bacterium]
MRPLTAPPSADCAEPLVPFPLPPVVEAAEGCEVLQRRLGMDRWMVARSPAMLAIGARAQQLADFEVAVLLLGESGSGKEVLARFIHECSPRKHHRFLKLNCAALPDELLESELFGYEPGAFTGATRSKPGLFEMAHKGTLFLDEIGEMPMSLQAKLLHVLQDHRFTRLGGREEIFADVRVLAATNVDLPQAMAERRFREDLFFRLNVFSLHLPPLRERLEDIPALLDHCVQRLSRELNCAPRPLTPEIIARCLRHPWPGNVRELENFVQRHLIFGDKAWLDVRPALPAEASAPVPVASAALAPGNAEGLRDLVHRVSGEIERQAIARALEENRWNRTVAARVLNISYRALLNKVRLYNLYPSLPAKNGSRAN